MSAETLLKKYEELKAVSDGLELEISKIAEKKKDIDQEIEDIRNEIQTQMLSSGMKKALIAGWNLNISRTSSTFIEEADLLPEQFLKVIYQPDKFKIKAAIKTGETIPGVVLKNGLALKMKKV